MTVEELIKRLEKCNPNGQVFMLVEHVGSVPIRLKDYFNDGSNYIIEPDERHLVKYIN